LYEQQKSQKSTSFDGWSQTRHHAKRNISSFDKSNVGGWLRQPQEQNFFEVLKTWVDGKFLINNELKN